MSVEREVYRQSRTGGGSGTNNMRTRSKDQPRRSTRVRNNLKTDTERKMKAKNLAAERKKAKTTKQQQNTNKNNTTQNTKNKVKQIRAPPKKAVNAAMKAMNTAGFTAPKGMKMVISFAPVDKPTNTNQKKPNNKKGQGRKKWSNGDEVLMMFE